MELLDFNNTNTFSIRSAESILSVFNNDRKSLSSINQDMSVDEISDIISDKLIEVVQSQFDETAETYHRKILQKHNSSVNSAL